MYRRVVALCEDNLPIVALLPAFETSYLLFKATIDSIMSKAGKLEAQTGGLRISKRTAKKELAILGAEIAGFVFAYASGIEDEVMKGAMDINYSDIYNARDEEVAAKCANIYNAAHANLGVLGDYGVTGVLLGAFEAGINNYTALSPKPRGSMREKQTAREQVVLFFEKADVLLKERMDKLALNFNINGNRSFYLEYRAARIIIEPGSFKTVLKLLVLNSVTNEPLRNVKCYRDASVAFKKSSDKGMVTFKDVEQGQHSFRLRHKLFKDAVCSVMMSYGEKKVVTVVMDGEK